MLDGVYKVITYMPRNVLKLIYKYKKESVI